jgi:hypothetical protein
MAKDDGQQSGKVVPLDFTPRELGDAERARVTGILERRLPGYELAVDPGQPDQVIVDVPEEGVSPPWPALQSHARRMLEGAGTPVPAPPDSPRPGADLRIYPIRRKGQAASDRQTTVVIAMKSGTIVSFNQPDQKTGETTEG